MDKLGQLKINVMNSIWGTDAASAPVWKAALINIIRVLHVLARELSGGLLPLRAMSLVYTSLLSLVPLLAVSFSVLKAFGVHNQLEPLLLNVLAPLGPKGVEISTLIIGFVENMKVGVLGGLGLALLFYTVVSLLQKIERAFNYTWHVKQHRPLSQRFSDYLSVLIIGPVLVFSAMFITASLMNSSVMQMIVAIEPFGSLIKFLTQLVPYLLIILAFTFIYIFIPNTKVQFRCAFIGATIAGILWESVGWMFAFFVVSSTKYTAVYSAFATLILFILWLYLAWMILLVGASIAFYIQNPESIKLSHQDSRLSIRLTEKLAMLAMFQISHSFYLGHPPWSLTALAKYFHIAVDEMEPVMEALEANGIINETNDDPPVYLPAKPLDTTPVKEVLDAVRNGKETALTKYNQLPDIQSVNETIDRLDQATDSTLKGVTLKYIAMSASGDNQQK